MRHRLRAASAALALVLLLGVEAAHANTDLDSETDGDAIRVSAQNASSLIAGSAAVAAAERTTEYSRAALCGTPEADSSRLNATCTGYADGTPIRPCEAGDPLPPVWRRTRETPADPWPRWTLALGWTCPEDALPELTVTDFQRLPLTPSPLTVQPARPQVLVNMPTIVYTEPTTQTFTTTLLDYPVEVEATPTTFTWDFGDDTDPTTTTSPGHPYPDHDIAQPYTHPGTYTITTTHTGRYRMAGTTPWLDVVGTATTTTLSGPIEAIEIRSHLVADDCITNPHGPYC